jgi:hypothetical protein
MTGGLFPKELTVIAGLTGIGKSTIVRAIQRGVIFCNQNKNVLHIANEESLEQVQHKFDAGLTGIPYRDFKLATITDSGIKEWTDFMDINMRQPGVGKIFVREVPAFTDVTLVEEAYRELEAMGIKIHVIVIDHLPHVKPIQQAWGENDERAKSAADCKEIARWCNCSVVVPTQAATVVDAKQMKGKRAGNLDVYGSKAQVHVANTFIIITEKGKDEKQIDREEFERDVFWLVDVKKARDGAKFWFGVRHHVLVGRITEEILAGKSAAAAAATPAPNPTATAAPAVGIGAGDDDEVAEDTVDEEPGQEEAAPGPDEAAPAPEANEEPEEPDEPEESPVKTAPKSFFARWRKSREKTQCSDERGV